jgi:dihydroneopterin aldolase
MNCADRIRIMGIECRCKVGVPPSERRRRQAILIDAVLEVNAGRAAARDDFRQAIDYQAVEREIRGEAEGREYVLIETVAERAAAAVLRAQPLASAVSVSVRKTPAAMPRTREVVVEIRRTR